MDNTTLVAALHAMRRAVGEAHVVQDGDALAAAARATYPTHPRPSAVVSPATREEVQACMRAAWEHGVPVYPYSTGKNWGYGSRVPSADGAVLLHLGRMNRIVALDEELAYVTLEPGVTQIQLHEHLKEKVGGRLWVDATASSPHSSVLGNTLERGHGVTRYADHVSTATGFEVVLADGTFLRTGFGALPDNRLAALDRYGPGPCLDGLFSQSNLGVVTQATVWLMPAPESSAVALFSLETEREFHAAVDALRPLKLDGTIKSGPHFGNVFLSLLRARQYPWDLTGGATPLRPEQAVTLVRDLGVGMWNGTVAFYGSRDEVAAQRKRVSKALKAHTSRLVVFDDMVATMSSIIPERRVRDAQRIYKQFTGAVSGTGLPRMYWRMKAAPPERVDDLDLDRAGVGLRYSTAAVPFTGRDVARATALADEVLLRHRFEPNIGIFPTRDRVLQLHISTVYDRARVEDDRVVNACHDELLTRMVAAGYPPFRLGIEAMAVMQRADPAYLDALRAIKRALDPKGVLAPGRYIPT